jgi:hypothetical protein
MIIKEKILKILQEKNISRADFYKKTGISNGYLDKNGSVASSVLEKILTIYPEVNLYWLITGEGSMYRGEVGAMPVQEEKFISTAPCTGCAEKSERIAELKELVSNQKEMIHIYKDQLVECEKKNTTISPSTRPDQKKKTE